ncbi:MAG: hypothetical protein ACXWTH_11145, partial [Methylosarcina sp.]
SLGHTPEMIIPPLSVLMTLTEGKFIHDSVDKVDGILGKRLRPFLSKTKITTRAINLESCLGFSGQAHC